MRSSHALVLAVALACIGPGAQRRAVAIGDDGRTCVAGGEAWRAPDGVAFFQRGETLHVVSLVPGAVFDAAVALDERGRPVVAKDAPFEIVDGELRIRVRALAGVERLVETGQLYRHDDHFHLTHQYANEDWQALYRVRAEDSPFPPVTRQVAAFLLAALIDGRIPGGSEEATLAAMKRADSAVGKARRAIEAQAPVKQVTAMAMHDFEIADGGRSLSVEGKTFGAKGDVVFTYCGDHFHVESPGAGWTQAILLAGYDPGHFEMPRSMFFSTDGGSVEERTGDVAWRNLLATRQIHAVGDGWFVAEEYANPSLARLRRAAADASLPRALRDRARRSLEEVLPQRLDVQGDAELRASLASIDQALERSWREMESQMPAPRRGR